MSFGPTPLGIFLISAGIAYAILAKFRPNFLKGRNSSKKQTDFVLWIICTVVLWGIVEASFGH